MNDIGYARGGSGIDSVGSSGYYGSTLDIKAAEAAGMGEWHFHIFGETVGLFALDVRQGSAGLQVQAKVKRRARVLFMSGLVIVSVHLLQYWEAGA